MKKLLMTLILLVLTALAAAPTQAAIAPQCEVNIPDSSCKETPQDQCTGSEKAIIDDTCPASECCVPKSYCAEGETFVAVLDACFTFGAFINTTLEWLMIAAALLALFRFTVGGIQYIFSQGQPDKLESAQQTITSAVFGLILVFIAWVLIQFVGENTPEWWDVDFFSITSP